MSNILNYTIYTFLKYFQVLHGEQYTELLTDKFPTFGVLSSTFKIAAILNKGSGSLYILDVLSRDKSSGEPVVKNQGWWEINSNSTGVLLLYFNFFSRLHM